MTQSEETTPVVRLIGIHKRYGPLHVLKDIHLDLHKGEKIVIIGASGCGKSTLLRCINALEPIDEGEIIVNGVSLQHDKVDLNRHRANIGIVFQQFNLFPHLSVIENLILGPVRVRKIPKEQAIEQARQLLERIGILEKANAYPDQLSGGQQQRVAIARSLAMQPEVMLFDEPTSALDPRMTREVLSMIRDVADQGMTLMVVTHEVHFAEQVADRILFMHDGQIAEEGPPETLFHHPRQESTRAFLENMLV